MSKKKNSDELVSGAVNTIAAIKKHLSKVPSMMLAGKTVATSDVAAALQTRSDAIQAAIAARGAWLAACDHLKIVKADVDPLARNFEKTVAVMFDTQTDVLTDFGIVSRKRNAPTAEVKAAAVVKTQATRKARLTVGPKAKLKIKAAAPTSSTPSTTK